MSVSLCGYILNCMTAALGTCTWLRDSQKSTGQPMFSMKGFANKDTF